MYFGGCPDGRSERLLFATCSRRPRRRANPILACPVRVSAWRESVSKMRARNHVELASTRHGTCVWKGVMTQSGRAVRLPALAVGRVTKCVGQLPVAWLCVHWVGRVVNGRSKVSVWLGWRALGCACLKSIAGPLSLASERGLRAVCAFGRALRAPLMRFGNAARSDSDGCSQAPFVHGCLMRRFGRIVSVVTCYGGIAYD